MKLFQFIWALYAPPPSPESIALRELEESRRELLAALTAQDYATALIDFHTNRIKRLSWFLKETMDEVKS